MASNISVPTYVIQHSGGKNSWQDGEIITANSLNKMQKQIKKNTDGFSNVVQYSTAQPTNQYNQVWINSNSQQNNRTIRLAQMDDVNTILENVNNFKNNVIKISDSAPEDPENKLWICSNDETQIQIPTYEQFLLFKTNIQKLVSNYGTDLNYNFIEGNYGLLVKTGTLKQDNYYKVTDYIDISGYKKLLYSKCKFLTGNTIGIYFYNENQTPIPPGIAGLSDTSSGYVDDECNIPEGAKYVRLTALSSNLQNFYVKGTFSTGSLFDDIQGIKDELSSINISLNNKQDELIFDNAPALTNHPVTSQGIKTAIDQQKIDLQNFVNDKIDKIFVSELPVTPLDANRSIAYYTGEIVNLNNRYLSDFIDISEWYAIQYMQIKSSEAFNDGIAFYTNNKNFLNGVPCSINPELGYIGYNIVVIPNNAKYVRFTMLDSNTYGGFEAYGMTQDYYVFKNKQDKLTFDQSPTINSTNPVTSNGIKNAVDHLENLINTNSTNINNNSLNISNNTRDIRNLTMTIALKQDQLFFDDQPTLLSSNPVKSGGIKNAIDQQKTYLQNFTSNAIDKLSSGELLTVNAQFRTNYCITYHTGSEISIEGFNLSDYVDIRKWYAIKYKQIMVPNNSNGGMAFFDNKLNYLSGINWITGVEKNYAGFDTVIVPEGAKYAKFTTLDSNTYGEFEVYGMTQSCYIINNKQDKLVFDGYPTRNSMNPVTSGGIYITIDQLDTNLKYFINQNTSAINSLDAAMDLKQDKLFFDSKPIEYSDNLITSGNIYTALHEDDTITVDGTAPSIMGQAGKRYICGTVEQIRIYLPPSGTVSVRFKSGETPTVLSLMGSIKWPDGFDPTSLEANTTYRLNFEDQRWATVDKWH